MRFHAAGKVHLDHIYREADPRTYFGTLRDLDYRIPELAKPHFQALMARLRRARGGGPLTILDIGCSYGINAALLRCDLTMLDLYERYCAFDVDASRDAVLAADRALVQSRSSGQVRYVGLDIAEAALGYATAAGFLDAAVHADLERDEPTPAQRAVLGQADLVISTGCLGYVTERTLARVALSGARLPWMAHTVLRMYSFEPVERRLSELGYQTEPMGGLLRQRRFASAEEQAGVLDTLTALGQDPSKLEADGWLYAQLFISIPRAA